MQKLLKYNGVRLAAAAVASYVSILAVLYYTDGVFWMVSSGVMGLLLWLSLGVLYFHALHHITRRRVLFSLLGGALLGAFHSAGEQLFTQFGITRLPIKWVGYTILYTFILCQLFYVADRWRCRPQRQPGAAALWLENLLSASRSSFLRMAGLLFLFWLPYYIVNWPGLVSPDVKTQISMWLGTIRFTGHHPIIHTAFLGLSLQLGRLLGSEALGLGLATLIQIVAIALTVAFCLRHMAVLRVSPFWRAGTLLFYALFPVFGWYATTLWKDVWLAAFALLFFLAMVEVCCQGRGFFTSKKRVICLTIATLGVVLSKNNGIYIVAFTILVCLISQKASRKKLFALLLGVAAFWLVLEGPVYSALGVGKGDVREALSIPMMQIAKVVALAPEEVSPDDQALIKKIMPYDHLAALYDPVISDPIKAKFDSRPLQESPLAYLRLWVRMGLNNPGLYAICFLEKTSGYWYPDVRYWIFPTERYTSLAWEGSDWAPPPNDSPRDKVRGYWEQATQNMRSITGFSMLFSVGFGFWALLAAALYAAYARKNWLLPSMVLFFMVWLTCLASPVFAEYRYAYPALFAVPVVLGLAFATRLQQPLKEPE